MNRTLMSFAMLFGVIALAAASASIAENNPREQQPAAEANNPLARETADNPSSQKPGASIAATIRIDASKTIGELKPVHRFSSARDGKRSA